jgi:hypothetical protein
MHNHIKQKSEPYHNPIVVAQQPPHIITPPLVRKPTDDILKGFILLGLALMISFTFLYILRHCITDMVLRYDISSKGEMFMYLLVLITFIVTFWLYLRY